LCAFSNGTFAENKYTAVNAKSKEVARRAPLCNKLRLRHIFTRKEKPTFIILSKRLVRVPCSTFPCLIMKYQIRRMRKINVCVCKKRQFLITINRKTLKAKNIKPSFKCHSQIITEMPRSALLSGMKLKFINDACIERLINVVLTAPKK
jgi:hypothetical protein